MTPVVSGDGRAVLCLNVIAAIAPAVCAAQQAPAPPDLPAPYHGSPIDKALKAREWPRAEELLVAAIERQPDSPGLLSVLGSVFLIEKKPLNAAIAIKKAEALAPLDDRSRFTLVLAYIALNHGDWARPELEKLVASDPSNPGYDYWLGRLDYDAGQYASAVKRFQKVIDAEPDSVRAYDNLGLCYEALNQPDDAVMSYRKAVELNRTAQPKSAWPPLNLGILLRNRGDLKEAEALLREAAKYEDHLAQPWYQLGVVLEQDQPSRRGDRGAEAGHRAGRNVRGTLLRAGADLPEAESQGRSRRSAGDLRAAPRRQASHAQPMSPAIVVFAVAAIAGAQAPGGAQKPAAAQGAPASLAPTAVLTDIASRLDRQDWAGARTAVDSALRTYPNDAALHNFAGVIDAESHAAASAEAHFQTSIRLAPREPSALREPRQAVSGTLRHRSCRARQGDRRLPAPARGRSGQRRGLVPVRLPAGARPAGSPTRGHWSIDCRPKSGSKRTPWRSQRSTSRQPATPARVRRSLPWPRTPTSRPTT